MMPGQTLTTIGTSSEISADSFRISEVASTYAGQKSLDSASSSTGAGMSLNQIFKRSFPLSGPELKEMDKDIIS